MFHMIILDPPQSPQSPFSSRLNIFQRIDLDLRNPQDRELMLTLDRLDLPISPLCLLLNPHWLCLRTHNPRPTFEKPLIQIGRPFQCVISGAETRCSVQSKDIPGNNARHAEWQAYNVASCYKVRTRVDVRGNEVGWLGCQEREEFFD